MPVRVFGNVPSVVGAEHLHRTRQDLDLWSPSRKIIDSKVPIPGIMLVSWKTYSFKFELFSNVFVSYVFYLWILVACHFLKSREELNSTGPKKFDHLFLQQLHGSMESLGCPGIGNRVLFHWIGESYQIPFLKGAGFWMVIQSLSLVDGKYLDGLEYLYPWIYDKLSSPTKLGNTRTLYKDPDTSISRQSNLERWAKVGPAYLLFATPGWKKSFNLNFWGHLFSSPSLNSAGFPGMDPG